MRDAEEFRKKYFLQRVAEVNNYLSKKLVSIEATKLAKQVKHVCEDP